MTRDLQSREREIAKLQRELQTATQRYNKASELTKAADISRKEHQQRQQVCSNDIVYVCFQHCSYSTMLYLILIYLYIHVMIIIYDYFSWYSSVCVILVVLGLLCTHIESGE